MAGGIESPPVLGGEKSKRRKEALQPRGDRRTRIHYQVSCCPVIISKHRKLVVDYKNINNKEKSTQNKTKKKQPQMFLGITEGNMGSEARA